MRPLLDDESGNPAAVTRDYRLELDADGGAPLLSVWGGKITTFRKLAEEAADLLAPTLGRRRAARRLDRRRAACRAATCAPSLGADAPPPADVDATFARFVERARARHPQRRAGAACAAWRAPTARAPSAPRRPASAPRSRPASSRASSSYLRDHEWARSGDDVLWRRSKLGLHLDADGRAAVDGVDGERETRTAAAAR